MTHCFASSFADPADVRGYLEAKKKGMPDQEAFRHGDNGIGASGRFTAQDHTPMCALPPEEREGHPYGSKIRVTHDGVAVDGTLEDTMPHERNITNGCRIDLNPAFARQLGVKPPFKIEVSWEWI